MCHCCDITKTVKSKKKDNFVRLIFGDFFWSNRRDNKMTKYVDCEIMNTL